VWSEKGKSATYHYTRPDFTGVVFAVPACSLPEPFL
jgi:hypothetical protein